MNYCTVVTSSKGCYPLAKIHPPPLHPPPHHHHQQTRTSDKGHITYNKQAEEIK
jgi:hypothetical protein